MRAIFRYLTSTNNSLLWILIGVAVLLLLWGFRMPGGDISYLFFGLLLVFLALCFVMLRIVLRLIQLLRKRLEVTPVFKGWCSWLICVCAISVVLVIGRTGAPMRWAFALSRPKLERLVKAASMGQVPDGDFWAGLYPFKSVVPIDGGHQFTLRKTEMLWGERGFYFSATGGRIDDPHYYDQQRIGSKWFIWHYGGW